MKTKKFYFVHASMGEKMEPWYTGESRENVLQIVRHLIDNGAKDIRIDIDIPPFED